MARCVIIVRHHGDLPDMSSKMPVNIMFLQARSRNQVDRVKHYFAHAGAYSNWEGIAPGAKIAFQDLGSDNTGTLSVPYDLFHDYFPFNYQWFISGHPPTHLLAPIELMHWA